MRGQTGKTFQAKVETVAFGGSGVARVDGLAAFIPFTVDGDIVEAQPRAIKKRHMVCRLRKIISPSPHRRAPRCPFFGRCGGCCYQHIEYGHQLAIKRSQVEEALKRIGGFHCPPVREIIASPEPYSYRGKAEFHFQWHRGEARAGFFDISGVNLVDVDRCEILHESINEAFAEARKSFLSGAWHGDGRVVVWSETGIVNSEGLEDRDIVRRVKDKTFLAPSSGFFQGNVHLTGKLVDAVCEAAACTAGDSVLDLYCGSGLFSVFLAETGARVFGVEVNGAAIACARRNAAAAGAPHADFCEGNVEDWLKIAAAKKFNIIILDPPRAGCDKEVLSSIIKLGPERVVYISCDPATQARDLRTLAAGGFSLAYVQPLDMFPQTMHIETVALLEKIRT